MPLVSSAYRAPYYLKNGHLATIFPNIFRKVEGPEYCRERFETEDGDFLDLDWVEKGNSRLLIISHGLEGSSERPYVRGMAKYFSSRGWDVVAWNCRSCSGEMNRVLRLYHHGDTEDLEAVIRHAQAKNEYEHLALTGFSMGGSMVLNLLGQGMATLPAEVVGGVVFSVPCDLGASARHLSAPGNGFYRKRFLKKLIRKMHEKHRSFPDRVAISGAEAIRHFAEFDNQFTAPLHGFENAEEFYLKASANQYLSNIQHPVLIVNAANDPFLPPACYPVKLAENHPSVHLEIPEEGGHVGFMMKGRRETYAEVRAYEFFEGILM
ncbi:YheT family hydrolase [Roseivirga sp. BDSF3-8]|uniref:YheT family hydrolase n=1 Tax=Roseivirga sp. BDSF3-8 TaxID=3241598 RepID=UPI0035319B95